MSAQTNREHARQSQENEPVKKPEMNKKQLERERVRQFTEAYNTNIQKALEASGANEQDKKDLSRFLSNKEIQNGIITQAARIENADLEKLLKHVMENKGDIEKQIKERDEAVKVLKARLKMWEGKAKKLDDSGEKNLSKKIKEYTDVHNQIDHLTKKLNHEKKKPIDLKISDAFVPELPTTEATVHEIHTQETFSPDVLELIKRKGAENVNHETGFVGATEPTEIVQMVREQPPTKKQEYSPIVQKVLERAREANRKAQEQRVEAGLPELPAEAIQIIDENEPAPPHIPTAEDNRLKGFGADIAGSHISFDTLNRELGNKPEPREEIDHYAIELRGKIDGMMKTNPREAIRFMDKYIQSNETGDRAKQAALDLWGVNLDDSKDVEEMVESMVARKGTVGGLEASLLSNLFMKYKKESSSKVETPSVESEEQTEIDNTPYNTPRKSGVNKARQAAIHGSGPSSRGMKTSGTEATAADIASAHEFLSNPDFQSFRETWNDAVREGREPLDSLRMYGASRTDVGKIASPEDAWILAQGKSKFEKFMSIFGGDLKDAIRKFTVNEKAQTGIPSKAGREVLKTAGHEKKPGPKEPPAGLVR